MINKDIDINLVKERALSTISFYFGNSMSVLYSSFYENKDRTIILKSVGELLREYLGEDEADIKIKEIVNNK